MDRLFAFCNQYAEKTLPGDPEGYLSGSESLLPNIPAY